MFKPGSFSGLYFPILELNMEIYLVILVFSPNKGKYGPEKTCYLKTFYVVTDIKKKQNMMQLNEKPIYLLTSFYFKRNSINYIIQIQINK